MNSIIIFVFVLGYLAIMLEQKIAVNKAASALLAAVVCWVIYFIGASTHDKLMGLHLNQHLAAVTQVVIFILGTMTIAELIDAHRGFQVIADLIKAKSKRQLLWQISFFTFFISSFLVNMTVAVIMIALMRRLVSERSDRWIFASMIVVASNAGGAWTPIGDTTTTMLWIGGQISTWNIMRDVFVPSAVSFVVPLIYFSWTMKDEPLAHSISTAEPPSRHAKTVLALGIISMLLVPVLTTITNIPPYMGVLLMLALMWVLTDRINSEKHELRVPHVLTKVDISSIFFFLGILLMVAALETAGILKDLQVWMDEVFKSKDIIVTIMGLASSVVDNIPLTAAAMGMYDLNAFPRDSKLWEMVAYCAGTGGSILIIGSPAGIVAMAMEKIEFGWYLKKVSLPVLVGYLAGIGTYLIIYRFIN